MSNDTTAPWLQLTLEAIDHSSEQLEDALLQAGALAVTLEDAGNQPVLEPAPGETPLWARTRVTGLFDAQTDIEVIKGQLRRFLRASPLSECRLTALEERDWVRAWMDHFHPMRFGQRLWVCPTGQTPPDPQAVNIRLDPGLAFGTGTHPTTALCLEWLDGQDLTDSNVLDFGCGSGILALAALKLGAAAAVGVDNDPQALIASADNAARNAVDTRLAVYLPDDEPPATYPVVVANILASALDALAEALAARVATGGRIALSGILVGQEDELLQRYAAWFDDLRVAIDGDWVRITGRRR